MNTLEFSNPNSKLRQLDGKGYFVSTFSIPAGHTCPGADQCFAKTARDGGLTRGANMTFQCFSASQENRLKNVRLQRWRNMDALQACKRDIGTIADLIVASIPAKANAVRIHVAGDFYSAAYFLAWCKAASMRPDILFYAYTKSLQIWVANKASVPSNLVLTASVGGKFDALISEHNLKSARVVFSIEEANGLPIDHDDSHAMDANCHAFAMLIHNVQPKGSEASKAVRALHGLGSYSEKQTVNQTRADAVDARVA